MKNLFFLIFLISTLSLSCAEKPKQKPNILFIFADDQRADALGISGNPVLKTPNIDELAKVGTRFTNAYVMGGNHGAICAASRAMMLSGKSLFHVLDKLEGQETMPMHFAKQGYETFGTGKWHNEKEMFEASFQKGKNVFLGGMADHFSISVRDLQADGKLSEPEKKGYSTDLFADVAKEFLEDYASSEQQNPFFAYVSFTVPHDPYSPKTDYLSRYDTAQISLPKNFMPLHPFAFDQLNIRDENLTDWPRKPEVVKEILSDYYSLITHLDDQVGKLISTLKEKGLYENTIIVYAADNGLAIGSHGLLGKQNLYEHSTKVPMIISGPGVPKDQLSEAFVYLYDLFPTLAELAHIPSPKDVDGQSLVPVLNGEKNEIRSSLFTAYRHTVRSIREGNWKLIRYPERDFTQLFNLKNDPSELNNLAENPESSNQLNKLKVSLHREQKLAGDTVKWTAETILPLEYDHTKIERKPDQWQPEYTLRKYFNTKD
ncbi:MAG: sulfatase-like hydrolase/transferase [Algoriphagus sp.]|uniref:sulfatase-like hydrolase/transferase n=1 Tax=Algoriphagus sp. TaxID=1872435 RepID=UPI002602F643|nr:sulfatase-like hydrolase/transferase [Algoriphagus sp.]MDG1278174.1 sulfatase-like hydrolase/transferase [Algoriphagus sp.]